MKTLADANTFAEVEINQRLTGEEKTHLLREMFRIRRFEQAALKQYQTSGQMGGFLHLYIGRNPSRSALSRFVALTIMSLLAIAATVMP